LEKCRAVVRHSSCGVPVRLKMPKSASEDYLSHSLTGRGRGGIGRPTHGAMKDVCT